MEATITVPEKNVLRKIESITIKPGNANVIVYVDSDEGVGAVEVNVADLIAQMTVTQRNVVRGFLRAVGGLALNVDATTLTGEDF